MTRHRFFDTVLLVITFASVTTAQGSVSQYGNNVTLRRFNQESGSKTSIVDTFHVLPTGDLTAFKVYIGSQVDTVNTQLDAFLQIWQPGDSAGFFKLYYTMTVTLPAAEGEYQFDLPTRQMIYSGSYMGVTLTDVRNPISFSLTENYPTYVYDVHEDNYPAVGDSVSFSNTPSMVQLSLAVLVDNVVVCEDGATGAPGAPGVTGPEGPMPTDDDECATNNGGCEQVCTNTFGSYYCGCNDGYTLNTDTTTCRDLDECTEAENGRCHHYCNNTVGSYYCYCMDGYNLGLDSHECIDIDECSLPNFKCYGWCFNTPGSFVCMKLVPKVTVHQQALQAAEPDSDGEASVAESASTTGGVTMSTVAIWLGLITLLVVIVAAASFGRWRRDYCGKRHNDGMTEAVIKEGEGEVDQDESVAKKDAEIASPEEVTTEL
ncbi:uncharacterized protein LOC135483472 [Lineus longissimus]|uniref:uncharacterized protein LOC135483472 n=1 Tax=Lineus longissimus TaxID=88925 RepID=UPI002B4E6926